MAGQSSIRPYWSSYYEGTHAIIFVIDATDLDRLSTAVKEFTGILHVSSIGGSVKEGTYTDYDKQV